MKDATKNGRPAKRDVIVIDDDDSINEQPVVKKGKGDAEAVFSAKLEELEKEVGKWKDKYQRAVRYAGEYLKRGETTEERLDSKYGIKEEFHAEKMRANELEKRLAEVSSQLEEAKRGAESTANLIDKLSKKLAVYEEAEEREKEKEAAKEKPEEVPAVNVETPQTVPELHEFGHPTNILQQCSPGSSESTSFEIAREKILSLTEKREGSSIAVKVYLRLCKLPTWLKLKQMVAHCVACERTLVKPHVIIEHFLGSKHREKCKALGAAVSSAALEYWVDKLQLKTQPAAAAASPKVFGARKLT